MTLVILVLGACNSGQNQAASEARLVRLQMPTGSASASMFPFYIADANSYFADLGITVSYQYASGGTSAAQQLVAGNADMAVLPPAATLAAAATGFDARVVYQHFYANRFQVGVLPNSSIVTMEDLRGSAIGVSDLAGGEVPTVRAAISLAGLDDDVDVIAVGEGASALLALERGDVSALGVALPDLLAVRLAGSDLRIITPDAVKAFPGEALVVSESTLGEGRGVLVDVVRATLRAREWTTQNVDEAYDILKEWFVPEQLADDSFGRPFHNANIGDTTGYPDLLAGTPVAESWSSYSSFLTSLGILKHSVEVEPLLVDDIVEAAWNLGLEPGG